MKQLAAATPVFALIAALSAPPVFAQSKDGGPERGAAPAMAAEKATTREEAKPAARGRARSLATADARHCLQLTTNMAIHRCAEKYRPR